MAYRDEDLPRGGAYGSTLRAEPTMRIAEPPQTGAFGNFAGGLLVAVLLVLGLMVGIGTLRVHGDGDAPATAPGDGAISSVPGE